MSKSFEKVGVYVTRFCYKKNPKNKYTMVKKASPTSNGGQNGGPHLTSIGIIKFIVCLNDVMPPWQLRIQIKVATIPAAC